MRDRDDEQKIYRTFEEFEREELRRMDAYGASVDEMIESIFDEEVEVDPAAGRRHRVVWDDEDVDLSDEA